MSNSMDDVATHAEAFFIIGSNTTEQHPVFGTMIRRAVRKRGAKLIVADPRKIDITELATLHLRQRPGTDIALINGLMNIILEKGWEDKTFIDERTEGFEEFKQTVMQYPPEKVAEITNIPVEKLYEAAEIIASSKPTAVIWAMGITQHIVGVRNVMDLANLQMLLGNMGKPGGGVNPLRGQNNVQGACDMGGLPNVFPAYQAVTSPEVVEKFSKAWGVRTKDELGRTLAPGASAGVKDETFNLQPSSFILSDKVGLTVTEMMPGILEGKVKSLYILGEDPVMSDPDTKHIRHCLEELDFLVLQEIFPSETAAYADVLLPGATFAEKTGTFTNTERRVQMVRQAIEPLGDSKPDWWIISEVAKRMGFAEAFNYSSPAQIFNEHAALSGFENSGARDFDISGVCGLDDAAYGVLQPLQWPVVYPGSAGTKRMFGDGRFYTPTQKARFIPVTPRGPHYPANQTYPLVLNTGRVRDHWHTLTRTGKSARLSSHDYEPYAELHPQDAASLGIQENDLVNITSPLAVVTVRALLNDAQRPGSVFAPMHWTDQFASHARVDALVYPVVDPISGQPESKHTPVRVSVYRPRWYGFLLSCRALVIRDATYWARAKGVELWRYELAGEQPVEDWTAWARALLCAPKDSADDRVAWVDYLDKGARRYRGARLLNQRLESCLFVAPSPELPSRSWLMELFALGRALTTAEHSSLLAARPLAAVEDAGATVCACFNVGRNTLMRAIQRDGLHSVEALGLSLKAGTNCGSCIPELKELIGQYGKQYA